MKIILKNYWLSFYSNKISYVGEATKKYNCHAYAWHITEGGDTVWIYSDNYMTMSLTSRFLMADLVGIIAMNSMNLQTGVTIQQLQPLRQILLLLNGEKFAYLNTI
jgi:hypothetical protein